MASFSASCMYNNVKASHVHSSFSATGKTFKSCQLFLIPQQHLETLQQQQQQTPEGADILTAGGPVAVGTSPIDVESGTPQMAASTSQQVFTVDTGMGNCDSSGMPTLADASLAETASRLQQVHVRSCQYHGNCSTPV